MSSTIAGSVAATLLSPTLDASNRSGNVSSSSELINSRFLSTNSPEIIHRPTMHPSNDRGTCPQTWTEDKKVRINIRGTLYETFESTLSKYPNTLLGSDKRNPYYDQGGLQYCFNRNKEAFDAILYYYQSSGKLIRPSDVAEEIFLQELEFFEIDPWNVAELEYGSLNFKQPKKKQKIQQLGISETEERLESSWDVPLKSCERKYAVFNVLLSWPCVIVVVMYLFATCLSSLPKYQWTWSTSCNHGNATELVMTIGDPLVILHLACGIWFLLEFLLRFTLSVSKLHYLLSFMGVIDMISLVSTVLQIVLGQADICQLAFLTKFSEFLRSSSFACIFKFARFSSGLRLLGQTLKACSGQLILCLYCVGICLLFFSAVIYHSESPVNEDFGSIVHTFWYTIVTLTTVGYGDLIPITITGKLFGAVCSVFGVTIVLAWPATVFVSYFTDIYNDEIRRKKKEKKNFRAHRKHNFKTCLIAFSNSDRSA